jgi:hypothetical protein
VDAIKQRQDHKRVLSPQHANHQTTQRFCLGERGKIWVGLVVRSTLIPHGVKARSPPTLEVKTTLDVVLAARLKLGNAR